MLKKIKDLTVEELVKLNAQLVYKQSRQVKVGNPEFICDSKVKGAEGRTIKYCEVYVNDNFYQLDDDIDVDEKQMVSNF